MKGLKYIVLLFGIGLGLKPMPIWAQPCSSTPSVQAGADTTICSSQNKVYLNASSSNSSGIEWFGGNGVFFPDDETANAEYVPSYTEVQTGYVDLIIKTTGNNPCPTDYDTVHIEIYSAPQEDVTGPLAICEYSSGNSYRVPALTGGTYEWHVVGGTIDSGAGTEEIKVTWGSEGAGYIYCVMEDSNGCQGVGSTNPISRFNFNTNDVGKADIGPDAVSYDSDAFSDGEGFGIDGNCNSQKGLDLEIPGSVMDRGKLAMTFSWQRDENNANFFQRGALKFWINGGQLRIEFEQVNTAGTATKIGPINTQYTVPNDDVYRYFTFAYDSSSGVARVLVNDSIIWNYETGNDYSLNWNGAGNAMIGEQMDGTCAGKPLLNWLNISIPISLVPGPLSGSSVTGDTSICRYNNGTFTADTSSSLQYTWSVTGGSLLSGQNTHEIEAYFSSLTAQVDLVAVDQVTGCDTSMSVNPSIESVAPLDISGDDTLCQGDTVWYTSPDETSRVYSWSFSGATALTGTSNDSLQLVWSNTGDHYVNVAIEDTLTGCSASDSVLISKAAYPTPQISGPDTVCQQSSALYNAQNTNYALYWTLSNGTLNSGQGTSEINVTSPGSGIMQIYLMETNTAYGCSTEIQKSVYLFDKPVTGTIQY